MLKLRDLEQEISEGLGKIQKQDDEKIEELQKLNHLLETIEPHETSLKDYKQWIRRYSELREELLADGTIRQIPY